MTRTCEECGFDFSTSDRCPHCARPAGHANFDVGASPTDVDQAGLDEDWHLDPNLAVRPVLSGCQLNWFDAHRNGDDEAPSTARPNDGYDDALEDDDVRLEAERTIVLTLGRRRFGEPNARIRRTIQSITSSIRLDGLVDRLRDADSWEDLLGTI
ncbi:MAG: hypothetical protein ACLQVD_13690 [Capsulimonadaceae bacterium]